MHNFASARLKLERGRLRIRELENDIARWSSENPIHHKFDVITSQDGSPQIGATILGPIPAPPSSFGAIFGDAIHNIRTALDHLATELVSLRSGNPAKVHFPFANSEAELEGMIRHKKFDRAGADCVALLKKHKPYKGGNELLRAIHDLDIADKHSTIATTAAILHSPEFSFDYDEAGRIVLKVAGDTTPPNVLLHTEAEFNSPPLVPLLRNADVTRIVDEFSNLVLRQDSAGQS